MLASAEEVRWLSVIARSLVSFSLHTEEMKHKNLSDKAKFLLGIGLSYEDAAEMLESSAASLRELVRVSRKKKTKRKGKSNGGQK